MENNCQIRPKIWVIKLSLALSEFQGENSLKSLALSDLFGAKSEYNIEGFS